MYEIFYYHLKTKFKIMTFLNPSQSHLFLSSAEYNVTNIDLHFEIVAYDTFTCITL